MKVYAAAATVDGEPSGARNGLVGFQAATAQALLRSPGRKLGRDALHDFRGQGVRVRPGEGGKIAERTGRARGGPVRLAQAARVRYEGQEVSVAGSGIEPDRIKRPGLPLDRPERVTSSESGGVLFTGNHGDVTGGGEAAVYGDVPEPAGALAGEALLRTVQSRQIERGRVSEVGIQHVAQMCEFVPHIIPQGGVALERLRRP